MYGVPYFYDYINAVNGTVTPSTIHIRDSQVQKFFAKYLLQKAISVFKWKLPEHWSKDYFLYTVYCWGFAAVFNTDKFGVIPQQCGLMGYDVFYRPTTAVISNPLFTGLKELRIGKQCVLVKLMPNYGSIMDIVNFYADKMALAWESIDMNLINSHLSFAFAVENKAAAEAMKKVYDKVASGEPAVFYDKSYNFADGKEPFFTFQQNVGQNYIVDKLVSDLRKIEAMFSTEIGIPNANIDKKERLIVDEVNANNVETASKCELWLEELQKSCEDIRNMFNIDISVDWRVNPLKTGGVANDVVGTGNVQSR